MIETDIYFAFFSALYQYRSEQKIKYKKIKISREKNYKGVFGERLFEILVSRELYFKIFIVFARNEIHRFQKISRPRLQL